MAQRRTNIAAKGIVRNQGGGRITYEKNKRSIAMIHIKKRQALERLVFMFTSKWSRPHGQSTFYPPHNVRHFPATDPNHAAEPPFPHTQKSPFQATPASSAHHVTPASASRTRHPGPPVCGTTSAAPPHAHGVTGSNPAMDETWLGIDRSAGFNGLEDEAESRVFWV